jgi:hypothetical protein
VTPEVGRTGFDVRSGVRPGGPVPPMLPASQHQQWSLRLRESAVVVNNAPRTPSHGSAGRRYSTSGGPCLPGGGRGVFQSLVAHRATLASARGFRYLQVQPLGQLTDLRAPQLRRACHHDPVEPPRAPAADTRDWIDVAERVCRRGSLIASLLDGGREGVSSTVGSGPSQGLHLGGAEFVQPLP